VCLSLLQYQHTYGAKDVTIYSSDSLMGPYREVQKFTGLPSAEGAVGNTGLSGRNHGHDVPINELVFNTLWWRGS
jgi:hypothetical protein